MLTLPLLLTAFVAVQAEPVVVPLWDGKAPLAVGDGAADKPSVKVFLAPSDKATGAAVVVCPGGGYGFLADDHEGKQVAEYFNGLGVHAFVLKYRIVTKDRPGPLGRAPLLDVQRAVRYVRANATKFAIDPAKVGLMGFSAGGHLASTGGTHFDAGKRNSEDPVERVSCRPDFLILAYPVVSMEEGVTHNGSRTNLLGRSPSAEDVALFSNEKQVTDKTPPTFLFHTDVDTVVIPENAVRFYLALKKAKVPAELHVYEKGRHGVGLANNPKQPDDKYASGWPERLTAWLEARGVLKK
jgi:acetyl esterase/lipase